MSRARRKRLFEIQERDGTRSTINIDNVCLIIPADLIDGESRCTWVKTTRGNHYLNIDYDKLLDILHGRIDP